MTVKKSAIIIGKGPSLSTIKRDYVDSFDDIIICNLPVWEGYQHILPLRATYQFRNNSTPNFSEEGLRQLGLKAVFSTALLSQKMWDDERCPIPIYYGRDYLPNLRESGTALELWYGAGECINPTSGIIAFSWAVNSEKYNKIAMAGFDMMEVNKDCYYFKPAEYQQNIRYLLGTDFTKDGKRKHISKHTPAKLIKYVAYEMSTHLEIDFETRTFSEDFIKGVSDLENVFIV